MPPDSPSWQEQLVAFYSLQNWWGRGVRVATVVLVAVALHWLTRQVGRRVLRYGLRGHRIAVSERRLRTLEGLLSGLVTFVVTVAALIWAVGLAGASPTFLLTALGLISAGLGLGARPLVSDYLAGLTLLFEYSYAFGEKVEILDVIGTVEYVGLRTTHIRADSGELFVVPNGDVRLIRNFSRGAFSLATVRVTIPFTQLAATNTALEGVAEAAFDRYRDELVDKPEIISETGELGSTTTLALVAKATFSHGAPLRRRLLADVQAALTEAGITPTV